MSKWVLAKICPTHIPKFVQKKGTVKNFFVQILNSNIIFFTFLLSKLDFNSNLALSELCGPKKNKYLLLISYPNFDIVQIIQPEFNPNPEFCQHYQNSYCNIAKHKWITWNLRLENEIWNIERKPKYKTLKLP